MGLSKINDENVLLDHLGSITSTIGKDGITKYTHDTFGQGQHFTGYQYDEVSELSYAQARFYDPKIGRFISEDVLVNNGNASNNFNRYAYCLNNPLKYVDKNGMWPSLPSIDDIVDGGKDFASGVGDFVSHNIIGVNHSTTVYEADGTQVTTNNEIGQSGPIIQINTGSNTGITFNGQSISTPFGDFGFGGSSTGINYQSNGNLNLSSSNGFEIFSHGISIDNSLSVGTEGLDKGHGISLNKGDESMSIGYNVGADINGVYAGIYGSKSKDGIEISKEIEFLRLKWKYVAIPVLVTIIIINILSVPLTGGATTPGLSYSFALLFGLILGLSNTSEIDAASCN